MGFDRFRVWYLLQDNTKIMEKKTKSYTVLELQLKLNLQNNQLGQALYTTNVPSGHYDDRNIEKFQRLLNMAIIWKKRKL